MEEKVLIKSEQYDVKKLFRNIVVIATIVFVVGLSLVLMSNPYIVQSCKRYYYGIKTILTVPFEYWETMPLGYGYVACIVIAGLLYFWLRSYELTVTNKRIYGKIAWGKRVDLPVDSVSATAMVPLFKGVSVSTSSGKISFLVIKNADEIYTVMNDLLIARQQEKANAVVTTTVPQSDEADQLKKYKDLLDGGVISQEEFDAKKKQLLGV